MKKDIIVKRLFDDKTLKDNKEEIQLERLKELDNKIAAVINKVRVLKEEKTRLEKRIDELEAQLNTKNQEVENLSSNNIAIKTQVEELLNELEAIEV